VLERPATDVRLVQHIGALDVERMAVRQVEPMLGVDHPSAKQLGKCRDLHTVEGLGIGPMAVAGGPTRSQS
jgi:hypothetical protein